MRLTDALRLLRPWQWYKNLVIFVPIVFSQNLSDTGLWPILLLGFAVLCLVSSISYAINDIFDCRTDRMHPDKKRRPIASGRVRPLEAAVLVAVLTILAIGLMSMTNLAFSFLASLLFVSNLAYSVYLKNVPLVDIHIIALNFIIRVISGVVILNLSFISPWLIVIVFLLALFMAVGKRRAEFENFGREKLKPVFRFYSKDLLNRLTDVTAAMLLISYILYTAFSHDAKLMFTIPLATFLVFRYLYFIYNNSEIARKSERVFLDKQMLAGILLWIALIVLLIYKF